MLMLMVALPPGKNIIESSNGNIGIHTIANFSSISFDLYPFRNAKYTRKKNETKKHTKREKYMHFIRTANSARTHAFVRFSCDLNTHIPCSFLHRRSLVLVCSNDDVPFILHIWYSSLRFFFFALFCEMVSFRSRFVFRSKTFASFHWRMVLNECDGEDNILLVIDTRFSVLSSKEINFFFCRQFFDRLLFISSYLQMMKAMNLTFSFLIVFWLAVTG